MATAARFVPAADGRQQESPGLRSGTDLARLVAEQHRKNLQSRRKPQLEWQRNLLRIDGRGNGQYADILYDSRVSIPQDIHPYQIQHNILRPITDNQVAWHTTMPFRFAVETKQDAREREKGRIDEAFANHVSQTQRLNNLFGQAMFMANATGFTPVHAYWRVDLSDDTYEPLYGNQGYVPRKGMIDCWVGNPFDTTFNAGAKLGSVQASWYGRVLPVALVNQAFEQYLNGKTLEGTTKTPSASVFQQTLRDWYHTGTSVHGSPVILGADGHEELIAIICREIAPGIDAEFPNGRLTIIGLNGTAQTDVTRGIQGESVLLADQDLPAGQFSWVNVYSHHAFDDVHGKPFAADLGDLQVQLNLAESDRKAYIARALSAPTIINGRLVDDMAEYNGFTLLETEPVAGNSGGAKVLELPSSPVQLIESRINDIKSDMYTQGGYQAASRGEQKGGPEAYRAIVALQQADDTIHGPTNVVFRDSVSQFMGRCWNLMKTYGDVPWIVDMAGSDYAHLASSYIDRTKLSDSPPTFRLVNFAGTPEAKMQQMLNLVTTQGGDGLPLMTTEEFRKKCPDSTLYDIDSDPRSVMKRRARTIAQAIRDAARQMSQQMEASLPPEAPMTHPWVQWAGEQVFLQIEQKYPRLQDDDLQENLLALSEITQDETEDVIARVAANRRQQLLWAWQAEMAKQQRPQPTQGQPSGSPSPTQKTAPQEESSLDPEYINAEMHGQQMGASA